MIPIRPIADRFRSVDAQQRAAFREGVRAVAPQFLGVIPFGLVAGVASVAGGLTPFEAIALSMIVFSGVAQLAIVQLLAVQAPLPVILVAVGVISLRLIMYSAAVAPRFAHLSLGWRWLIASHLTDQAMAVSSARGADHPEDVYPHWFYLGAALPLFVLWQATVIVGALVGSQIPAAWSLDFAVTLSFVVLLRPAIKQHADKFAAAAAIVVSLIAIGMPYRLSLVVATFAGVAVAMLGETAIRARKS